MPTPITLELPDETLRRYQQGASAAQKPLEEFLIERLTDASLPLAKDLPSPLDEILRAVENLDDEALWEVVGSRLSPEQQHLYETLLEKNSRGTLTEIEQEILHRLGDEARLLTLKKAHAYMLLKWRGYTIPSPEALIDPE